tara:strand:+ start:6826 stop:7503 length:678 start_codon:yes stop_codon:yes gene_type:complete
MRHWIKYKNGRFGGVYQGDSIEYGFEDDKITIDENTSDQDLFSLGILRLNKWKAEFPNRPYKIQHGPKYEFVNDGSAEVNEVFDIRYETFEEIRNIKIDTWYMNKDGIHKQGVYYNGRHFDCRFRNMSHLSILASMIPLGKYPENFEYFDSKGERFLFPEEDCIGLLEAFTKMIVDLETSTYKVFNEIMAINDIDELIAYAPKIEFEMYNSDGNLIGEGAPDDVL